MIIRRRLLLHCLAVGALLPWHARADEKPAGKIVLVVTGKIGNTNDGERFVFDMAMLEKLPQYSITTKMPWYPGANRFTGPLLRDVLKAVGAGGEQMQVATLNDYKASVPLHDATRFNVILAHSRNDKPMPVREKGPLFIVYPFDTDPALQSKQYYVRSAWQVTALDIQ